MRVPWEYEGRMNFSTQAANDAFHVDSVQANMAIADTKAGVDGVLWTSTDTRLLESTEHVMNTIPEWEWMAKAQEIAKILRGEGLWIAGLRDALSAAGLNANAIPANDDNYALAAAA